MIEIGLGIGVLSWSGITHSFRTNLDVVEENLNAQHYPDEILSIHVIPIVENNANIILYQHDNVI
jgi:hypothetical protein